MAEEQVQSFQDIKRIQNIPPLVLVEGRPFAGIDLAQYVRNPTAEATQFTAELLDGAPLPAGLTCAPDGLFSGTPEKETARREPYKILFVGQSESTWPLVLDATLVIVSDEEAARLEGSEQVAESVVSSEAKQFWQQVSQGEMVDPAQLFKGDITREQMDWLLERFATLTAWNADDLSLPSTGKLIEVKEASPHFRIYDFGVALVAAPADLYDEKRSFVDAIQTARAVAREIRRREWKLVEFTGLDRLKTAAWIETQNMNCEEDAYHMDVRYNPTEIETEMFYNQFETRSDLTASGN